MAHVASVGKALACALLLFGFALACTARTTEPREPNEAQDPTRPATGMDPAPADPEPGAPATVSDFADGSWLLHVDRAWNGSTPVALPSDMLDEADFEPAEPSLEPVMVSNAGSTVTVGTKGMSGSRARTSTATRLTFELSSGTFAGGRFVVWQGEDGLEGELTLYGSGRPIVQSQRGKLERAK